MVSFVMQETSINIIGVILYYFRKEASSLKINMRPGDSPRTVDQATFRYIGENLKVFKFNGASLSSIEDIWKVVGVTLEIGTLEIG